MAQLFRGACWSIRELVALAGGSQKLGRFQRQQCCVRLSPLQQTQRATHQKHKQIGAMRPRGTRHPGVHEQVHITSYLVLQRNKHQLQHLKRVRFQGHDECMLQHRMPKLSQHTARLSHQCRRDGATVCYLHSQNTSCNKTKVGCPLILSSCRTEVVQQEGVPFFHHSCRRPVPAVHLGVIIAHGLFAGCLWCSSKFHRRRLSCGMYARASFQGKSTT